MLRNQYLAILLFIGLSSLVNTKQSFADQPIDLGSAVTIEEGTATPSLRGGKTRIRFVIVNDGPSRLRLIGMTSPVAETVRLLGRTGTDEVTGMDSIGVSSGERLELTTSHLWYEAYPVARDLVPGDTFNITLDFVDAKLTVPVHVHG